MKDISIVTLSGLSDTLPDSSDSMYQIAALNLMIRKNLEALAAGGISFQKPELSDFSTYSGNLDTWLTNAYNRETEIINQGFSSIAANLPDVLAVGQAYISGGATAVGGLILNKIMGRVMGDSGARAGYRSGETGNINTEDLQDAIGQMSQEISAALADIEGILNDATWDSVLEKSFIEAIKDAVLNVLTEFNINVFRDPESQTYSMGPLED